MSTLSSKKDLQAQVMGTLLAPISTLAAVIAAIVESKGGNAEAAAE
jgi:large subunit ribosomal protein L10